MGQEDAVIRVDMTKGFWDKIASVFMGILAGLAILLVIALAATGIGALAGMIIGATVTASIGSGAVIVSVAGGVMAGIAFHSSVYPADLILPVYSISPEEIFKGQILLFDIDFFNPVETIYARLDDDTNLNMNDYETDDAFNTAVGDRNIECYFYSVDGTNIGTNTYGSESEFNDAVQNGEIARTSKQNTALELQSLVSQWYSAIRNIAIVLSMSVLLYIGIRMLLSSVAQDKAKYRQMLIDWVVSLCLLFFMHYIMAFSVEIVNQFTKVVAASNSQSGSAEATGYSVVLEEDKDGMLLDKLEDLGMYDPDEPEVGGDDYVEKTTTVDENGNPVEKLFVMWPTNLMGQLRLQAQMSYGDASFIGYGLCFFVLTLLTIFYVFTYLKRVLYMAFLTMIAPLVALTYPIDKISDGQAQAFNKWLKEYIFNLLIQPLHLLIYTILVTSAFDLAGKNVLYSLAAIGFLIPAEKLMRSFFGFEKASTPGSLAGAAVGAGLVNTGLQRILHGAPPGKNGKSGSNGRDGDDSKAPTRIGYRGNDTDPLDIMAGGTISDGDGDEPISSLDNGNGEQPIKPLDSGNNDKKEIEEPNYDEEAMKKYQSEGFGQNAFGHYFNPHENEFDENYNPVEDEDYNQRVKNENEALKRYQNEGFGQNAFGHYFNPSKNEFDAEYDPRTDKAFNKGLNKPENVDNRQIDNNKNDGANKVPEISTSSSTQASTPQSSQTSTSPSMQKTASPKKITGSRGRPGRMTAGDVVRGTGRALKYTAKRGTKDAIRSVRRTVGGAIAAAPNIAIKGLAGAALGATAGAIGVGAAIASGDPSNLITYGGGAALAAGTIGASRAGLNISNTKSATQIARERAFYGDKYDDHVAEKNMKKWKRDDEKRQELERYLGAEATKKLYKERKIDKYLQNEITDAKDIAALEQLQNDPKAKVSFNDAMVFYDAHSRYGDIRDGDVKKRKEIKADYAEKFEQRGNNKEKADKQAQRIVDMTHKFDTLKKNLNKA